MSHIIPTGGNYSRTGLFALWRERVSASSMSITSRGRDFNGVEVSRDAGSLQTYRGPRNVWAAVRQRGRPASLEETVYDSQGRSPVVLSPISIPRRRTNGMSRRGRRPNWISTFLDANYRDFTFSRHQFLPGETQLHQHPPEPSWMIRARNERCARFRGLAVSSRVQGDGWEVNARGFYRLVRV